MGIAREDGRTRPIGPPDSAALVFVCLLALLTFAVYARTAAPTVTWRNQGADSGDLVTAAINLGVPHPTGYPLYTLLLRGVVSLPGAEPAHQAALWSAFTAALTVGLTAWTAFRTLVGHGQWPLALLSALAGAAVLASSELLWSQATIAEVYSTHALLTAALLALALSSRGGRRPYWAALLVGFGLAHHLSIGLLLPALWPYVPATRKWLSRRRLLKLVACLVPGALCYLYVPFSAARHAVPNWGQADSGQGFLWLVTAQAYRSYWTPNLVQSVAQRLPAILGIWLRDWSIAGVALALVGAQTMWQRYRRWVATSITYCTLLVGYAVVYASKDSFLYLVPLTTITAVWMAWGSGAVLQELAAFVPSAAARRVVTLAAATALVVLPLVLGVRHYRPMDLSADYAARDFAVSVLEQAQPSALIISCGDEQTFALWYVRYGLGKRPDVVVVDRNLLAFAWYRAEVGRLYASSSVAQSHDADAAVASLLASARERQPVHLTYDDEYVLSLGRWSHRGLLWTIVAQ